MKKVFLFLVLSITLFSFSFYKNKVIYHVVDLHSQNLQFFWKDSNNLRIANFKKLKTYINPKKLIFAMNGGMFNKDFSPQGLYIEKGKVLSTIDTIQSAYGNFYMQPNGILYITKNLKAVVCRTEDFVYTNNIQYATQSGPMLLIDGELHSKFRRNSKNTHIRNGVGILSNGNVLFAISKEKINFYDFATFFKSKGCKNALYLDGFVSKMYLPNKNFNNLNGNFGVIIAEIE